MINVDISIIRKIADDYLMSFGFSKKHIKYIVDNLIEAELSGKTSHGINSLLLISNYIKSGSINSTGQPKININASTICVDSNNISGYISMGISLDQAMSTNEKTNNFVIVAVKNMSYSPGYIGAYARQATESGYFFLGFSKSPGGIVPHGGTKGVFGTNPITFSIPFKESPVIVDTSIGKINFSTLLGSAKKHTNLANNVAIDEDGKTTINPSEALKGGILPIAGHKGSSLALISEILAGAFIDSSIHSFNPADPKWGYFYILGKTDIFVSNEGLVKNMDELNKKHMDSANSPDKIFYPGERSNILRNNALQLGKIKIDELILNKIKERIV